MFNLQEEIRKTKVRADDIIEANERLKQQLASINHSHAKYKEAVITFGKRTIKMHQKMGKFSSQIQRVEQLDQKYP